MSFKLSQTQIFTSVLMLTLGIIFGAISFDYYMKYFYPKSVGPIVQISDKNTALSESLKNEPKSQNLASTVPIPGLPSPNLVDTKSTTTTAALNIAEPQAPVEAIKDRQVKPEPTITIDSTGQSQTLKNLKITLDKIEYTSNTLFKDPKSQIKDSETFALLNITIENISDETLNLDGRAYLIEIFEELIPKNGNLLEPKQVVYKPAKELGPTFSQSKSSLIRYNFKPKQKFSGVVGFKIPKETKSLNFYYPDVSKSKEIALFRLR